MGKLKTMEIKTIRITEASQEWQRAGVHFVRAKTMVEGFEKITLKKEFEGDSPNSEYILALDGKHPVGTCRLSLICEDEAKIERVCVLPEYQGRGVGAKIIRAAENWLAEKGFAEITIMSREEVAGFYEALGYKADYGNVTEDEIFRQIYTHKTLQLSRKTAPP
jgi:GNAT superfamily N-acetyltransferase